MKITCVEHRPRLQYGLRYGQTLCGDITGVTATNGQAAGSVCATL